MKNVIFLWATAFLVLASSVYGNVFVTSPVSSTVFTAGNHSPSTITWQDDGEAPPLKEFGQSRVTLCVGDVQEQPWKTSLQTISHNVYVSRTSSLTFNVDPSIGPDSDQYFIRFESLQFPTTVAFSAKFRITNMSGASSIPLSGTGTTILPPASSPLATNFTILPPHGKGPSPMSAFTTIASSSKKVSESATLTATLTASSNASSTASTTVIIASSSVASPVTDFPAAANVSSSDTASDLSTTPTDTAGQTSQTSGAITFVHGFSDTTANKVARLSTLLAISLLIVI